MLLLGDYVKLSNEILKINGLATPVEEQVKEVKN
jgi:hypothetical protein